jgi:hypothetical protein
VCVNVNYTITGVKNKFLVVNKASCDPLNVMTSRPYTASVDALYFVIQAICVKFVADVFHWQGNDFVVFIGGYTPCKVFGIVLVSEHHVDTAPRFLFKSGEYVSVFFHMLGDSKDTVVEDKLFTVGAILEKFRQ